MFFKEFKINVSNKVKVMQILHLMLGNSGLPLHTLPHTKGCLKVCYSKYQTEEVPTMLEFAFPVF